MKDFHGYKREVRSIIAQGQKGCTMPEEQRYEGVRSPLGCEVWRVKMGVKTRLNPRHDLWSHSPTGFEWGYCGSGPAQLALALLADALGDDYKAVELHQAFKFAVVGSMGFDRWTLTLDAVLSWVHAHDQVELDKQHAANMAGPAVDLGEELP